MQYITGHQVIYATISHNYSHLQMIHDDSASISHNISGWIDTTDSLSRDPRDLLLNHPGDGHTLGLEILGVVA
jgi:hypothetical protein